MATLVSYNPVRDFVGLADTVSRIMEDDVRRLYGNGERQQRAQRCIRMPLDAYTTDDAFVVLVELPGVAPEQVEITFEGNELTIRGDFTPVVENASYVMQERLAGPFERRLTFNVPVDADKIEAVFEHGILRLHIPKAESLRPKQIKVRKA